MADAHSHTLDYGTFLVHSVCVLAHIFQCYLAFRYSSALVKCVALRTGYHRYRTGMHRCRQSHMHKH